MIGPIGPKEQNSFYCVDYREPNTPLLDLVVEGCERCIMLSAPPGSGRTTKLYTLMEQLKSIGYACAYVSFAHLAYNSEAQFWKELSQALSFNGTSVQFDSKPTFIEWLTINNKDYFGSDKVVLIFDDIDELLRSEKMCHQLFGALGIIKSKCGTTNCLSCCIAVCQHQSNEFFRSPFGTYEALMVPNFTQEQVNNLFIEFAADRELKWDPSISSDIYRRTAGHPSMVSFCALQVQAMVERGPEPFNYSKWMKFALMEMPLLLRTECEFFSRIQSTVTQAGSHMAKLLQGPQSCSEFKTYSIQPLKEAGVVIQEQFLYKISSPIVRTVIAEILTSQFYHHPNTAFPLKEDGRFNTSVIIRELLPFFCKKAMVSASSRGGNTMTSLVPSTSCYHIWCFFTLCSWVRERSGTVVGDVHRLRSTGNYLNVMTIKTYCATYRQRRIGSEQLRSV